MPPSRIARLIEYIRERHPRSLTGVMEARAVEPERFDTYAETLLTWAERAFGPRYIERLADAFVRFSTDVNLAQARYEAVGHYENTSFQECQDSVYSQSDTMDEYLLGIYLTNFLWAHHMEISLLFEQRFLSSLHAKTRFVEIAPGHGGWGLWALSMLPSARLDGFDISPMAITMASQLATAAGLHERARYALQDALLIDTSATTPYDACICSFLIEHLEQPDLLVEKIARLVRTGGKVFLTGALTAAQVDHIYEFREESEFVLLAEQHGMRVLEMRSVGPRRTLPGARFLPRSAALILEKRSSGSG